MKLTPTSITLFLVQIGTLFSELVVVVCCCFYVSSYPKSPEATSLSPIACGTLAFAVLSTLFTLVLLLRQKSGRTMRAIVESAWVIFATAMWILAAIGGIAYPPNGMSNVSCKILPSGNETSDPHYKRACQAMFASTAFCILSALFFVATAIMLFVFSVKRSIHDRKNKNKQVGGHYELSMTPSQYRRSEKESEEGKTLKGAGEHEEEDTSGQNGSSTIVDGHFSDRVYTDHVSVPLPQHTDDSSRIASDLLLQQQQLQHQYQHQHQGLWAQQPAYGSY